MPGIRSTESHRNREFGALFDSELWWRDEYQAIEAQGYILRPRYHPNWCPSWKRSGKDFFTVEDGQPTLVRSSVCLILPMLTLLQSPTSMDGTRACDGRQVMFKKISAGNELEITKFLSSPGLMRESQCVPLLEILELPKSPEQKLLVMPLLRPFDNPRFQTFGEFVSFFAQICDVRLEHRLTGGIGIPDNSLPRVSCSCTNEILRTGVPECFC
jgi:hypothetical protein